MERCIGLLCCVLLSCALSVAGLKDAHPHGEWAAVMAEHRRGPDWQEAPVETLLQDEKAQVLEEDAGILALSAQPESTPDVPLSSSANHHSVSAMQKTADRHSASAMQRRRYQTQGPYTTLLLALLIFLPLFVAFVLVVMFVAGPQAKNPSSSMWSRDKGPAGVALASRTSSRDGSVRPTPRMSRAGSFVAREGTGLSVSLLGAVRPQPQEAIVHVVEAGQGSADIFAQVCISEDQQGTGILVHGYNSQPVAMLDTSFAFGARGLPPANRMVRIHRVEPGSTSFDYVPQPYAEVRPSAGGFAVTRGAGGAEELMSIRTDAQSGKLSQVVSKGSVLAQLEVGPNGSMVHMSAGSFERHMLLCAIVAAMKLG